MKLIMESWRNFIKENKAAQLEAILKTLGIHMEQSNVGFNIVLVEFADGQQPKTVGMIETSTTDQKCIPVTHEIGAVGIDPKLEGTGVGTYLYEVAALLVHINYKGGITSDHMSSTTTPAKDVWDRLTDKFNYIKRKTPKGPEKETYDPNTGEAVEPYKGQNDKFDYVGWDPAKLPFEQDPKATPDPNDDCDNVDQDYAKAATDHSLAIPPARANFVRRMLAVQMQNYDDFKSNLDQKQQQALDDKIIYSGDKLFKDVYNPDVTGIYGNPNS